MAFFVSQSCVNRGLLMVRAASLSAAARERHSLHPVQLPKGYVQRDEREGSAFSLVGSQNSAGARYFYVVLQFSSVQFLRGPSTLTPPPVVLQVAPRAAGGRGARITKNVKIDLKPLYYHAIGRRRTLDYTCDYRRTRRV